jgi:putative membrane protein
MAKDELPPDERVQLAKERTELAEERTRLANERTFSAWLRTGLATAGAGIAIIRLLTFRNAMHQSAAKWIGGMFVCIGIAIFILSLVDYLASYDKFKPGRKYAGSILAVTLIACALAIAIFMLLAITVHEQLFS